MNHINLKKNCDIEFKNYLLEVKRELEIIAEKEKAKEKEKNRLLEVAKRPSTVTRLKVMKKNKRFKLIDYRTL